MEINLRGAQKMIEKACSKKLQKPDIKRYKECAEMWSSRPDLPAKTLKFVIRKMQDKNPKVQLLALELLDYSTNMCDIPFHTQLASRDFLKSVQTLILRRKSKMAPVVYNKLSWLCVFWHTLYAAPAKREMIGGFADNYKFLKSQQVDLPSFSESKYAGLRKQKKKRQKEDQSTLNKRISDFGKNTNKERSYNNSHSEDNHSNSNQKNSLPKEYEQLKKDLTVVNENILLINSMIDHCDPKEDWRQHVLLNELVETLQGMENRLHRLIGELENEKMMAYTLSLNDDLTKTLQRYNDLKKGIKPETFLPGGQNPFASNQGKSKNSPKKKEKEKALPMQMVENAVSFEDFGSEQPKKSNFDNAMDFSGNKQPAQEEDVLDLFGGGGEEEVPQQQQKQQQSEDVLDLFSLGDPQPQPQQQLPMKQAPQQQDGGLDLFGEMGNQQPVQQVQQQQQQQKKGMNFNNLYQTAPPKQQQQMQQQQQQMQNQRQMDKYSMFNTGQGGMSPMKQQQMQVPQMQQRMQMQRMQQQQYYQTQQPIQQMQTNFNVNKAPPPTSGMISMQSNTQPLQPIKKQQKQNKETDVFADLDDMMGMMDNDDNNLF